MLDFPDNSSKISSSLIQLCESNEIVHNQIHDITQTADTISAPSHKHNTAEKHTQEKEGSIDEANQAQRSL